MSTIRFHANRIIAALSAIIWDILTDYLDAHQRIIPTRAFSNFVVEAGGHGAGTVIRFDFRVAGATRHLHQNVLVPEPGRVLVEHDIVGTGQTTFRLIPQQGGKSTQLDIVTELPTSPGLRGTIEGLMGKLVAPQMQRLYDEELANLDQLARAKSPATAHA